MATTQQLMGEKMKNSIASRTLRCEVAGKSEEVIVRFGVPQQEEDYFTCEYEISIAGENETYQITGTDGVHALQLAMFMAGSAIQALPGATGWSWNGAPFIGLPTSLDQPILGLRR